MACVRACTCFLPLLSLQLMRARLAMRVILLALAVGFWDQRGETPSIPLPAGPCEGSAMPHLKVTGAYKITRMHT